MADFDQSKKELKTNGLELEQYGKKIYQFFISARTIRDLIESEFMDVDRWAPDNPDGYQRIPTESRYRKFGKYVVEKKGISPTSVLLSLRDENQLNIEHTDIPGVVKITIDLSDNKIYIPDGQHRSYGLKWAVDEYPGECDDYKLPVVLFVADGEDARYEEANQFFTINTNLKKPQLNLAQEYLKKKREVELGDLTLNTPIPFNSTLKDLIPYGVKIADILNGSGLFQARIQLPNQNLPSASISRSSFVDSLTPLLKHASEYHWTIEKTKDAAEAFWQAVKQRCPLSFNHWSGDECGDDDHFDAVLVKTAGIYSLNDILARSQALPEISQAPTSPEAYERLLSKDQLEDFFTDGPEGYWSSKSSMDEYAAGHGTSKKSFKDIADSIWEAMLL
jgi:DGQHR domain-containing protein